eukprot:1489042-Alexandrium_andersonii.AAC.1
MTKNAMHGRSQARPACREASEGLHQRAPTTADAAHRHKLPRERNHGHCHVPQAAANRREQPHTTESERPR